jgi:sulfoxide reductase heme-binding subunit YedZ
MRASLFPWNDRTGRFSALRLIVFLALLAPAVWIAVQAAMHWLGPRPGTEVIHQTGLWTVRFLAVTLAITPLRYAMRINSLVGLRRMIGVAVLFYALLHLALYGLDQHFNLPHIASEIVKRIYLTIGFVALCGLIALGVTSTDAAIRKLGPQRWGALHKIVYSIAALGTAHFFMQSKLDVSEPIIMGGIFALLMLERLARRFRRDLGVLSLAAVSVVAAFLTASGEAFWYSFKTGAPVQMILAANLDFSYAVRPAWYVLAAGVVLVLARLLRPLFSRGKAGGRERVVARLRPAAAE